jgi:hypothetical protein
MRGSQRLDMIMSGYVGCVSKLQHVTHMPQQPADFEPDDGQSPRCDRLLSLCVHFQSPVSNEQLPTYSVMEESTGLFEVYRGDDPTVEHVPRSSILRTY